MFRHIPLLIALPAACLFAAPLQAEEKTIDVKIKDITLSVPADWHDEEIPDQYKRFRLYQFKIDPVDGDKDAAELVVSSFGGGGGIDPNLTRWIKEFDAEGRKVKLTRGKSKQGDYYLCDLTGTYNKRIGPPVAAKTMPMPGARALEVILQAPDAGVYFLKFTGPEKTVTAAADAFRKSFGGDAEKEEEYEVK